MVSPWGSVIPLREFRCLGGVVGKGNDFRKSKEKGYAAGQQIFLMYGR